MKSALEVLRDKITTGHSHLSVTDQVEILIKEAVVAMEEYANQFKHPDNEADGIVFCGKCGKQK